MMDIEDFKTIGFKQMHQMQVKWLLQPRKGRELHRKHRLHMLRK